MADLKKYYSKPLHQPLSKPDKFKGQFADYLGEEEQLLWSGKPKTGLLFKQSDFFQAPFAAIWLYIVVTGFIVRQEGDLGSAIDPISILFVCVGLYLLIGRFIYEAIQRYYSYYALTNQRIMVNSGITSSELRSTWLNSIVGIKINERRSGEGSLTFETVGNLANNSVANLFSRKSTDQDGPLSFEKIAEVRQVYDLVTKLQSNANT